MDSQQLLQEMIEKVNSLPETPSVALQVNSMLNDPNTDAKELGETILMDPSLTAQVLKICNSAEYGFSRKIGTVSEAVTFLGYFVLKRIIFTIISHCYLSRPVQGYAIEQGALWENAVTCGTFAQHIAKKVEFEDSELAFVGGLLRDIGKIAIDSYIPQQKNVLEQAVIKHRYSFMDAEQEIIGVNHATIGYHMGIQWNLPQSLLNIIQYHHHPSEIPNAVTPGEIQLVTIVHLADVFTTMLGVGLGIDGLMYSIDNIIYDVLPFSKEENGLERLYAELLEKREEIQNKITALANA